MSTLTEAPDSGPIVRIVCTVRINKDIKRLIKRQCLLCSVVSLAVCVFTSLADLLKLYFVTHRVTNGGAHELSDLCDTHSLVILLYLFSHRNPT